MDFASNPTSSAYLLVVHGSRDPRPQQAIENLVRRVVDLLGAEAADRVGWAALELQPQPLHQQICQFLHPIATQIDRLHVMPLFLLPGVHVCEDIPAEVELARREIGTRASDSQREYRPHICIHPYLGSDSGIAESLTNTLHAREETAWVLLAHGSRYPGGNRPISEIAVRLQEQSCKSVLPAYWSVPPSLETQVRVLVRSGYDRIGILPYFLFAGGITDAIAQTVDRLASQFPHTHLSLAEPLGVSDRLVRQIVSQIESHSISLSNK